MDFQKTIVEMESIGDEGNLKQSTVVLKEMLEVDPSKILRVLQKKKRFSMF